jgi:hypothetical protein
MKPTLKDMSLLSKFPVGKWFAAGAYGIHGSRLSRLYRLGLLDRRPPLDSKMARTWDYFRTNINKEESNNDR